MRACAGGEGSRLAHETDVLLPGAAVVPIALALPGELTHRITLVRIIAWKTCAGSACRPGRWGVGSIAAQIVPGDCHAQIGRALTRLAPLRLRAPLFPVSPLPRSGLVLHTGCGDEESDGGDTGCPIPGYAAPESLVQSIAVIYNAGDRSAAERLSTYESLFDPDFVFRFLPGDVANGSPRSWGLPDELSAHAGLFESQESGEIFSLSLEIEWEPAVDLAPPQDGREGWKEVLVTSAIMRVLFNPEEGLEWTGAQSRFLAKPANGRWYLADWQELSPSDSTRGWGGIKSAFNPNQTPLVVPGYAAPESLLQTIAVIYNDTRHGSDDRLAAYRELFHSGFTFNFQDADIGVGQPPLPASWGLAEEMDAHTGLFGAQDRLDVESLTLGIAWERAVDLNPPQVGREGWKEVFAPEVHLRLMVTPDDGIEVNGGRGIFYAMPAEGRWYLAEWHDLPAPIQPAVEAGTWGRIKGRYR